MKRSFAYLVLALMLSVLLCACGDTLEHGSVTSSPWPDVTTPIMPTPTADFSVSPIPDFGIGNEMTENDNTVNNDAGTTGNDTTGMSTSTPIPTDNSR